MQPSNKKGNNTGPINNTGSQKMDSQAVLNDLLAVRGKSAEEQRKALAAKYGDYYTPLRQLKKSGAFDQYNTTEGHNSNEESIGTNDWKTYSQDPNASHQNMTKAWIDQLGLPQQPTQPVMPTNTPPAPIQTGQMGANLPKNVVKVQGGYQDYMGNMIMSDEEYNRLANQQNQTTPTQIDPNTGRSFDEKKGSAMFNMGGKIKDYAEGGEIEGPTHEQGGVPAVDPMGEQVAEVEGGERIFSIEDTQAMEQMAMQYAQTQDQNILTQIGQYVVQALQNQDMAQQEQEMGMEQGGMPMDGATPPPIARNGMKITATKKKDTSDTLVRKLNSQEAWY